MTPKGLRFSGCQEFAFEMKTGEKVHGRTGVEKKGNVHGSSK
jgi:hypothetical protein